MLLRRARYLAGEEFQVSIPPELAERCPRKSPWRPNVRREEAWLLKRERRRPDPGR